MEQNILNAGNCSTPGTIPKINYFLFQWKTKNNSETYTLSAFTISHHPP